jgi:hypothetical protein
LQVSEVQARQFAQDAPTERFGALDMAFILLVAFTGIIVYGIYAFATKPIERAKVIAEFQASPIKGIAFLVWLSAFLTCSWGVIVPSIGLTKIWFGRSWLPLWQVAGVVTLTGFVIGIIGEELSRRRRG